MRVLVIAPQPFFSPRGTPFSVYYRTMITSELGADIDLLTYGEGQDVEIPRVRIIRGPRFAFLGDVPVGPSLLKLFLDVFIVLQAIGLMIRNRYDVVHAHEEAIFFVRFLKPIFGFKLIYDMHSSLPQQLTNFQFTTSKLLIGLFAWLEDSCLAASDAIITICPDLRDQVDATIGKQEKHFLIENSIFDPVALKAPPQGGHDGQAPVRSESVPRAPAGKTTVIYAGTFEAYQGVDLLLEAAGRVVREDTDVHFLLLGGTPDQREHYEDMAAKVGVAEHCTFTGRVQPEIARAACAEADVLLSPRIDGTNTPLKVYEQLASGIPLVATRIYSHTQILDDEICFLAEPTAADFADAILRATSDEPARARVVAAALARYEDCYSRPAYVGKMRRLFEGLA